VSEGGKRPRPAERQLAASTKRALGRVIGPPFNQSHTTPMPHLGRCLPDPFKVGSERNLTVIAPSPRVSGIRRLLDGIHQAM
jgi:hypothetical protein